MGGSKAHYAANTQTFRNRMPIMSYGNSTDFAMLCRNLGFILPTFKSTWIRSYTEDDIFLSKPQETPEGIMPEVRGLTIRDAVYMLENMGLKVKFSGYGKVISQSIPHGARIRNGLTVVLNLSSERDKQKQEENKNEKQ